MTQGPHGLQRNTELQSKDFYLEREREWFYVGGLSFLFVTELWVSTPGN